MARFFPRWTLTRSQLELSRFTFYLMTPITIMYYVGIDTDKKFNLPGYWPDPDTLNKIPKEPHEIQAELARMRQAKIEKRLRLEERAKELGITPESVRAEREAAQKKLLEDEQDEDEQNRAPLPEGEAHKQDQ